MDFFFYKVLMFLLEYFIFYFIRYLELFDVDFVKFILMGLWFRENKNDIKVYVLGLIDFRQSLYFFVKFSEFLSFFRFIILVIFSWFLVIIFVIMFIVYIYIFFYIEYLCS